MKPVYVIIVIGTLLVIFMVLASKRDKVIDIKPKSLLTTPTPMQYNAHPSAAPMGTP